MLETRNNYTIYCSGVEKSECFWICKNIWPKFRFHLNGFVPFFFLDRLSIVYAYYYIWFNSIDQLIHFVWFTSISISSALHRYLNAWAWVISESFTSKISKCEIIAHIINVAKIKNENCRKRMQNYDFILVEYIGSSRLMHTSDLGITELPNIFPV